jgi:cell wall-associated NlpC family hydrolase
MSQWVSELIGKPWVSGARGPDSFDCWGLLCWVYEKQFGVVLDPTGMGNPEDLLSVMRFAVKEAVSGSWAPVTQPRHGDAVGMGLGKRIHHVGAKDQGNVVAQQRFQLASLGINTVMYYRHANIIR